MGMSGDEVTIGYKYYVGMHMVICHGPINEVDIIRVGDVNVYDSSISDGEQIYINKPQAFGGERKEGGIKGYVDVEFGDQTQETNDYLEEHLPGNVPAYRGVVSFILRQVYVAAMNPYIKQWSFRAKRIPDKEYAAIGNDMNPAEIIYECLTNNEWGMGYPSSDIGDSFDSARQDLHSENFGLSMLWSRSIEIEEFIQNVLDHIEAVLYVDIFTGKFELRLVRDDYNVDDIPVVNKSNIQEIKSYSKRSSDELINTIIVNYVDVDNLGKTQSITVHNLGLFFQQGSQIISQEKNYNGITNHELANKVAARDLLNLSTELSTVIVVGDRSLMFLRPGDVFKLEYEEYGVESEIMRVSEIDYGKLEDGLVTVKATQDIFGVSEAIYSAPVTSKWEDPISGPQPVEQHYLYEATYPDWLNLKGSAGYVWEEIDDDDALMLLVANSPTGTSYGFDLHTKVDKYKYRGNMSFCPNAILSNELSKEITSNIDFEAVTDIGNISSDKYCIIEGSKVEFCELVSVDTEAKTAEIKRGIYDTVPQEHPKAARIWFCGFTYPVNDGVDYVDGETVKAKCLTNTPKGTLDFDDAPEISRGMEGRMIRPYPPGNFKINDDRYLDYIIGDSCDLFWSHRSRLSQEDTFVAQDEGDIGPEEGTTYQVIIYDEDDNEVVNEEGLTDTSYSYSIEQEIDDLGKDRPNEEMRVVIKSHRDGYESWQNQDHTFEGRGYGMFYGDHYGE